MNLKNERKMKRIKSILWVSAWAWLGLSCTQNTLPEAPEPEPWQVTVSRADTGTDDPTYNRILILGQKSGTDASVRGILSVNGTTGTWEGTTPTWPTDNNGQDVALDVYAFSPVPEGDALPQAVDLTTGEGTAWQMDYQSDATRPTEFTMTHLLAKLVVHVRIDGEVNPQPTDGSIRLYAKGEIDYPGKKVTTTEQAEVPLGIFHQEGQDEHSTEHNWEMETAIVVIPQEIPAGEPCLWFTAYGRTYTFTPQTRLKLEAGVVNNLYLGVAVDGPVLLEGITVTDWETAPYINGGEAEEE